MYPHESKRSFMKNEVGGQEVEREDPEKRSLWCMCMYNISLCIDKNACWAVKEGCVAQENVKNDAIFIHRINVN